MSRKLHKFQTEAEYQAYSASTEYTTPCVALIVDTNVIYYDYGSNKPQAPDLSDYKGEFQESSIGGDYWGKSAITKVHYISSGVTDLDRAFMGYTSLQEVTCELPSGVTDMYQTFSGCTSLITSPEIPSGVTSMDSTFFDCSSLVNAPSVIPSGVTNMWRTFKNCSKLVNAPRIQNGVNNLRESFYGCSSLVNVLEIPYSVTQMMETFCGCSNLVNVAPIPSEVMDLQVTFSGCTSLKELTILPTTPQVYWDTLTDCPIESIYVPDSAIEDYRTATGWSKFADKIKPLSSKPSE